MDYNLRALDGVLGLQGFRLYSRGQGYQVLDTRANIIDVTLAANTTFEFSGPAQEQYAEIRVVLRQDTTGGWTVTWPSAISWLRNTSPSLPLVANAVSMLTLVTVDGGVTWIGMVSHAPTIQYLTVGSSTYTTPANATWIDVLVIAGGGGAGGTTGSATQACAGGGGGSGGWLRKAIANPNATYAYTAGAKGSGSSNADGSAGSDSTFGAGGGLLTAKGGGQGFKGTLGTTFQRVTSGSGGAVSTGGDINVGGTPGSPGLRGSATEGFGGNGGSTPWGAGGRGVTLDGAGSDGTGYGAGGGGAVTLSINTNRAGGNGTDGLIVVEEHYD